METRLKILAATDYSEGAENAVRYAVELAKNTNSSLFFLHIYKTPFVTPSEPIEFAKSVKELYQSEMKRLKQHCDDLLYSLQVKEGELFCEYLIREGGSEGTQIAEVAEEAHADFIVVGTHGVSGFRRLFFGSHSWAVIKKSSIPVLVIPKGSEFHGIKNIVFGTEYREGELPVLNFLVHVASMFRAEITVLHITNYVLTKKFETEMFKKFSNEIAETISYPKLKIRLMVSENISEGVHTYCAENNTDLLVMSPEKPFLFEKIFMTNMSMTRKTIFQAHIPLMAIPDFYNPEHSEFWNRFDVGESINKGK